MKKLLLIIIGIHSSSYSTMPDDLVLERTELRNSYEIKKLEYAEKILTFNDQLESSLLKEALKPLASSLYNFLKKIYNPQERFASTSESPKSDRKQNQVAEKPLTKTFFNKIKKELDYTLKKSASAMNLVFLMSENLKFKQNQNFKDLVRALTTYLIEFYTFDMSFENDIDIKKIEKQNKNFEKNILFVSASIPHFDEEAKNKEKIYKSIQSLIQHYQYNASGNIL